MATASAFHQWMVDNLEKPFLKIELQRCQALKDLSGQDTQGAGVIAVLSAYAAIYTGFCAYWFVKYVIG